MTALSALTTPREQWAAAINDAACDSFTLLAYADWLEEQGDGTARAWRWFAKWGKEPDCPYGRDWNWWTDWPAISDQTYRGGESRCCLPIEHAASVAGTHQSKFGAYEGGADSLIEAYPNTEIPRP